MSNINFAHYWKAIAGALVTPLAVLGGYLIGDATLGDVTAGQWVWVLIALLGGGGVVAAAPANKPES